MPGSCGQQKSTRRKAFAAARAIADEVPVRAYIKVWTGLGAINKDRINHLGIFFFTPGTAQEDEAYEKAGRLVDSDNAAMWAVSVKCIGACAGIPVVGAGIGAKAVRKATLRLVESEAA
jgi:hypothetical protein